MNLKKKEMLLFVIINSILVASPIIVYLLFAIIIANMNVFLFKQIICFICLIIFFFFKFLIFPFLYNFSKLKSFYKEFFDKLNNNIIFSLKILFLAFIIDFLTLSLWGVVQHSYSLKKFVNYIVIFYITGLGGLSLSYLAMILWLKVKKYHVPKIVTVISIILSILQFIYFIYTKGGFYKISLLFFLPAIFVFAINYPFKKEENPSAFEKILIGILNFIILILVQIFFMTGILFI